MRPDADLLADLRNAEHSKAWMRHLIQQGKIFGILSLNFTNKQTIPIEKVQPLLALSNRIATLRGIADFFPGGELFFFTG